MKLTLGDYQKLFDCENPNESAGEYLRRKAFYRTRSVKAGDLLYLDIYPVWDTEEKDKAVAVIREKKKDKAAIAKVNERNARRKAEQILNLNFGPGDCYATLTYRKGEEPENEKRAMADMSAYIRRLKRIREKRGLTELKYFYTEEITNSKEYGTRYHFHMVTGGDLDRETIEACWEKGIVNSRRVQKTAGGMSGIANYMTKQKETQRKGARRWNCSQNLKRPQPTTNDHKISRWKAEAIAIDCAQFGRSIFEALYKGYHLLDDVQVKYSKYCTGAYISVRMEKNDEHGRKTGTDGEHGAEKRDSMVHHARERISGD